jgi:hypothetical protein
MASAIALVLGVPMTAPLAVAVATADRRSPRNAADVVAATLTSDDARLKDIFKNPLADEVAVVRS